MIQRIQTVFLLLAFALHTSLFFMPLLTIQQNNPGQTVTSIDMKIHQFEVISPGQNPSAGNQILLLPMVVNLAILVILAITIFYYKNRQRQYQLCRFAILLDTALIVAIVFTIEKLWKIVPEMPLTNKYHAPLIFPVIALIFIFLALRAIRKDEVKVRSADRLR